MAFSYRLLMQDSACKTRISIGEKLISAGFPLREARFKRVFRKCGEKSETSEHKPIFGNKTAGRVAAKLGSGRLISVLPRTSEIARRKYAANSGTPEHTALFA